MANAVLVERITAALGANAVLVQAIKTTATAPTGNAVLVQSVKAAAAAAPTANAGPDQSVEPWTTVTLTGTASTGSSLTYAWSGPAGVTLAGSGATRTFTAPPTMAGVSYTFSLTVTDGTGIASTPDTVVVSVLPATEFVRSGGSWLPRRPLKRSAGAWS